MLASSIYSLKSKPAEPGVYNSHFFNTPNKKFACVYKFYQVSRARAVVTGASVTQNRTKWETNEMGEGKEFLDFE